MDGLGHNNNQNNGGYRQRPTGLNKQRRVSEIENSTAFHLSTLPPELRMSGKKNSKVFSSSTCVINRLLSNDTLDSLAQIEAEHVLESGDQDKLEAILEAADPNKLSAIIKVAWQQGNHTLASETLAKLDPVRKHGNHYKLLHFAVKLNDLSLCQKLITEYELSPNAYCQSAKSKETPVHLAAKLGHLQILTYLHQEAQGDLNASQDLKNDPWTPLMAAAEANQVESIQYLLDKKVDTSPIFGFSPTPLHIAAERNNPDAIRTLLAGGAMVNQLFCPKKRITPLHVACSHGFYESAKVLLEFEADPDTTNGQGETSLHLACKGLQSDLIHLLINKYDANVTARDQEGRTPLHFLLNSKLGGKRECIEILFKSIANSETMFKRKTEEDIINMADKHGWTPLHYAAYNGRTKSLQFLIENKADLGLKNKAGQSGLNFAVKYLPAATIDALENMLDKSIQCQSLDSPDGNLTLSFDSIAPPASSTKDRSRSNVQMFYELLPLIEQGRQKSKAAKILLHPLSQCYLHLKWSQVQLIYYLILFCHFVYSACYTAYSIIMFRVLCRHPEDHSHPIKCTLEDNGYKDATQVLWVLLVIFTIAYCTTEFLKITSKTRFIGSLCSLRGIMIRIWQFLDLEMFLNLFVIVSFCAMGLSTYPFQEKLELSHIFEFNAVGLFVIWLLMMFLIARLPKFGIFVEIFKNVSWTFLQFLFAFGSLFFAFLFTFIVLFPNLPFYNGPGAVVKLLSMTMGELTYNEHFYEEKDDSLTFSSHFPIWSHLFFTTFLFCMSVVVVNLLFGLAVNETQELFKQAKLRQLVQQVKMTHFIEDVLYMIIQSKLVPSYIKSIVFRYRKGTRQLILPMNNSNQEKIPIPHALFGDVKQKSLDLNSTTETTIESQLQELQTQVKQLTDKLEVFMNRSLHESSA